MKPRIRDYIDIYFILISEKEYTLKRLILDAKAKFDWDTDPVNLSSQFLRVKEFIETKEVPKMLVPFKPKEMEDFFLKLAKSLEGEIFKS